MKIKHPLVIEETTEFNTELDGQETCLRMDKLVSIRVHKHRVPSSSGQRAQTAHDAIA
jgi:hypothetical protein